MNLISENNTQNFEENERNQNYSKGGTSNRKNFSSLNLGYVDNSIDKNKNIIPKDKNLSLKGKQNVPKNNGEIVSSTTFYGSYFNNKNK